MTDPASLLEASDEVADLLAPYAAVDRTRPDGACWVMANMVGSLSGSAAIAGRVGALSHGPDAALFQDMRTLADVVLVGAETVRREGYGSVRLDEERVAVRRAAGRADTPAIAVVSGSLRLDFDAPVFRDAPEGSRTLVVTCESADPALLEEARGVAEVVVAGTDSVDPRLAMAELGRRGHRVVLCEGGPRWLGELAGADVLDELCLTIAPVLGGDPLPISVTPAGAELRWLSLRHVLRAGDTLFLRYERARDGG